MRGGIWVSGRRVDVVEPGFEGGFGFGGEGGGGGGESKMICGGFDEGSR